MYIQKSAQKLFFTLTKFHILSSIFEQKLSDKDEGCPILRQIYAHHCIVLYPHNNRLTIQYN